MAGGNKKPRSTRIHLLIGALVSAVALYFAVRKVDWTGFVNSFYALSFGYLILGVALQLSNLSVRGWRWLVLVRPIAPQATYGDTFRYYQIGYMANLLFPLKPGEVIRPYYMGRKVGASKTGLLGTVATERLGDIAILGLLFLFASYIGVTQVPVDLATGVLALAGAVVVGLVAAVYLSRTKLLQTVVGRVFSLFSGKLAEKAVAYADELMLSIRRQSRLGTLTGFSFLSLLQWTLGVLTIHVYLRAFGIDIPWYAPIFVVVIANYGMMVPSLPGAIGVAHFLYVYSLALFGVGQEPALGFAVLLHGLSFLLVVTVGVISLSVEGLSLKSLQKSQFEEADSEMNASAAETTAGADTVHSVETAALANKGYQRTEK